LKELILVAYHIEVFQLSGGPAWFQSMGFDKVRSIPKRIGMNRVYADAWQAAGARVLIPPR
jgi:hypothetical protein